MYALLNIHLCLIFTFMYTHIESMMPLLSVMSGVWFEIRNSKYRLFLNSKEEDGRSSWEEWPLSVGGMDAVVELLASSDHPITRQPCVTLLIRTFAKIAHKWLQVCYYYVTGGIETSL